jgi:hypothetical protein
LAFQKPEKEKPRYSQALDSASENGVIQLLAERVGLSEKPHPNI